MGNALLAIMLVAGSILNWPAINLVTEIFAKDAVLQDSQGLAAADKSPTRPDPAARTRMSGQTGIAAAAPAPILAVLASAPAAPPTAQVQPIQVPAIRDTVPPAAAVAAPDEFDATIPSPTLLALTRDRPSRRPDGSVFMPIGVQNMIGLRTAITRIEPLSGAVQIPGRVVTSRDVGALIQSTQAGVIEAADKVVPRIGMRVGKGELLAYQRPILDAMRAAELGAKMAEFEGLVDMGEQRIVRLREVMFIRYRQSKIEAVQAEIASYRRQLQIYRSLLSDRVEIRARSAGVISRVNFVSGQIVEAQAILFEIVDPKRLWVEAAAFDPGLTDDIDSAEAITGDGRVLKLRFTGGGLTLQNQAVPLQFEVIGPGTEIQIGKPVTVVVRRRQALGRGIRLPAEAVMHSAAGGTVVWQRLSAEAFASRPVQIVPLDGSDVMVTSGLTANMRVVTASAAMLAQVR